jgi:hypothetical protein
MKDAKENRYPLHSVLREIQELMAVTRPIECRLSLSLGNLCFKVGRHDKGPLWVKSGKAQNEHITSDLLPKADIVDAFWHFRFVSTADMDIGCDD